VLDVILPDTVSDWPNVIGDPNNVRAVSALAIAIEAGEELAAWKFDDPSNTAWKLCGPAARLFRMNEYDPSAEAVVFAETVPSTLSRIGEFRTDAPVLDVILPDTVSDWPNATLVPDNVKLLEAFPTVSDVRFEFEALKWLDSAKVVWNECDPALRLLTVNA
jgi:hypothetical protein